MLLPDPRGPLSAQVTRALAGSPLDGTFPVPPADLPEDVLHDDDLQLALWVLYELHFEGFADVDGAWEWDPRALAFRARLETDFLAALRDMAPVPATDPSAPLHERIEAVTELAPAAGLSRFLQREATKEQFREYLTVKSVYHLKESDPSSFVLPRLRGLPKVRLAELQYDEYGGGRPDRHHQTLFANTLRAAGLDDTYGTYLDLVPGITLAVNNAMSLFGLHRQHRGAAMGHLAAFEATSSIPCRRIAQGMRRIGLPEAAADYFDEHVEADAVHEQLAMREICGSMAEEDAGLTESILFGSWVCCYLDYLDGVELVGRWSAGESVLRGAPARQLPRQRHREAPEMVGAGVTVIDDCALRCTDGCPPVHTEGDHVEVVVCGDGPALVRGAEAIYDLQGQRHVPNRPVVGVCLCGRSQRGPWCDGTHKFLRRGGSKDRPNLSSRPS